ncbi:hypothetical protein D1872_265510 [compost metagenome]
MPESNQQEGGYTRKLPESIEHHDIVREHHAQHSSHEHQEKYIEALDGFFGLIHVIDGIEYH